MSVYIIKTTSGEEINTVVGTEDFIKNYCDKNGCLYEIQRDLLAEEVKLNKEKAVRIQQSKANLQDYLATHPILWTDGKYYSITSEKQQWLTSKLFSASAAIASGQEYSLTWNDTEEVCQPWSYENLWALAREIEKRVTALVTYQQKQEVAMRNATTQEALDAIVVDYDSVSVQEVSA